MCRGQKRFQDVLDLLGAAGFAFLRFTQIGELSGPRQPIGLRGCGRQIWADALFLRRPSGAALPTDRLLKLAFTALVFGHVEFALAWLDQVMPDDPELVASDRGYAALLRDVKREATGGPMPPLLGRVVPSDRIQSLSTTPVSAWEELFDLTAFHHPAYLEQLDTLAGWTRRRSRECYGAMGSKRWPPRWPKRGARRRANSATRSRACGRGFDRRKRRIHHGEQVGAREAEREGLPLQDHIGRK
jgi:hypothetical protein